MYIFHLYIVKDILKGRKADEERILKIEQEKKNKQKVAAAAAAPTKTTTNENDIIEKINKVKNKKELEELEKSMN